MKITSEKLVTVRLELTEMEATALAQLCVQVGGVSCLRRDFYHEVWRRLRATLGDIPSSNGVFRFKPGVIECTGDEPATQSESKAGGSDG